MQKLADRAIAYDHLKGLGPCVVFCSGFNSNRRGNKARALEEFCRIRGLEYVRFDYAGHGDSGGDFADSNISTWLNDTLAIIDRVATSQKVLLVGSSMGGWLALNAALQRPDRIAGLVLLACAADMTRYYPPRLAGLKAYKDELGRVYYNVPNDYDDQQSYHIYQALIDDGEHYLLLGKPIDIQSPVYLIHGVDDDVVEWQRSQQVMHHLRSDRVTLTLVKKGDHRLSTPADLSLIERTIDRLVSDTLAPVS